MTTQPKDLMTLEGVIKGIETLRLHECGSSNRAVANLYDATLHHLAVGRKWTREKPTREGKYWIKNVPEDEPNLVTVVWDSLPWGGMDYTGWIIAEYRRQVDKFPGWWCGPILPPPSAPTAQEVKG